MADDGAVYICDGCTWWSTTLLAVDDEEIEHLMLSSEEWRAVEAFSLKQPIGKDQMDAVFRAIPKMFVLLTSIPKFR